MRKRRRKGIEVPMGRKELPCDKSHKKHLKNRTRHNFLYHQESVFLN